MSEAAPFHPIVEQIISGSAPEKVRSAAARGALPLPQTALVDLFIVLGADPDEGIRVDAAASLANLSKEVIVEVLRDPECTTRVLEHFASAAAKDPDLAERVAFHLNSSVKAVGHLARHGKGTVIDLVLTNQERLLEAPMLLNLLMENPALQAAQRGRILDLLDRISQAEARKERREESEEGVDEEDWASYEQAAQLLEVDVGELLAASEIIDGEEFAQSEDDEVRSAYQRILRMNTSQKAIAAMKGNREERLILIRDSNKTVSVGVLKNPRISEMEVESIAKMRNVSDEVLRRLGQNRDWVKKQTIMMALVMNPRTPPGVSTNFISRLQNRDLKSLTSNREVPELLRKMSQRTLQTRLQKASKPLKK